MPDFIATEKRIGLVIDLSLDSFPAKVWAWENNNLEILDAGSHFGYVFSGKPVLTCNGNKFPLETGMHFCVPNNLRIEGGNGIVIIRLNAKALFQIGGPIEEKGRLRYIDGCSDTLLIPPWIRGEACLNHLHFPKNISQTMHIHPSNRICIIARGNGICKASNKTTPLTAGKIFIVPTNCLHAFFTENSSMDVIAFHPDSDFGPTHEDHPMINRTIVKGISASKIEEIRTRE